MEVREAEEAKRPPFRSYCSIPGKQQWQLQSPWEWRMVSTYYVLNPKLTEFGNVLRRREESRITLKYFFWAAEGERFLQLRWGRCRGVSGPSGLEMSVGEISGYRWCFKLWDWMKSLRKWGEKATGVEITELGWRQPNNIQGVRERKKEIAQRPKNKDSLETKWRHVSRALAVKKEFVRPVVFKVWSQTSSVHT